MPTLLEEKTEALYALDQEPAPWVLREIEAIEKAGIDCRNLVDFTNGGRTGDLARLLMEGCDHSHRTLQQAFIGGVIQFLLDYAGKENYDGRNEFSIKVCGMIKEALKDISYKGKFKMPLI